MKIVSKESWGAKIACAIGLVGYLASKDNGTDWLCEGSDQLDDMRGLNA